MNNPDMEAWAHQINKHIDGVESVGLGNTKLPERLRVRIDVLTMLLRETVLMVTHGEQPDPAARP